MVADDGRRLVHAGREGRGGPGLVMVFQEPGHLVLIVEFGAQMVTHGTGMAFAEAVIQPLIIGVIESLLLKRPFQVPVDLGHEAEARSFFAHALSRLRPERLRLKTPSPFEDVGQDEHGHVAAHSITLTGDLQQLPDHRLLRGGIAVVELKCVRPAREVRIAPVGEQ